MTVITNFLVCAETFFTTWHWKLLIQRTHIICNMTAALNTQIFSLMTSFGVKIGARITWRLVYIN